MPTYTKSGFTVRRSYATGKSFPTPHNDNWANRDVISGASGTIYGDARGSTAEGGEWSTRGTGYKGSVWYEWTCPADGKYSFWIVPAFPPSGTPYIDGWIARYTHTGALPTASDWLDWNDDGGNNVPTWQQSRVNFKATAGVTYDFAVSGWQGGSYPLTTGPFVLHWEEISSKAPANDEFANAIELFNKEMSEHNLFYATAEANDPVFWVPGSGLGSGWWSLPDWPPGKRTMFFKFVSAISGSVTVTTLANYDFSKEMGDITVYVFDGDGVTDVSGLTSGNTVAHTNENGGTQNLTFTAVAGRTYYIWVTAYDGQYNPGPYFKIKVRWPTADIPPNDDWANATEMDLGIWYRGQTNENATQETDDPLPGLGVFYFSPQPSTRTVWYTFFAVDDNTVTLDFENMTDWAEWVLWEMPF